MSILSHYKKFTRHQREKVAPEVYQLKEFEGQLWLTYSGALVCPCSMLAVEPVDAVNQMRDLYIKRERS